MLKNGHFWAACAKIPEIRLIWAGKKAMFARYCRSTASEHGSLIFSGLFPDKQLWQVFLSPAGHAASFSCDVIVN